MKKPLRDPKVNHEWRTTFILAVVIALLCVAIVIVAAMRYF
jgi:signal transduction histidine kinase